MSEVSRDPYEIVTTKQLQGKTEHHPQGMSSLGRLYACAASYTLSKDEPEIESEYAKEGTLLHECAAHLIGGRKGWDSKDLKKIDEEQRDLVERCYDFFDEHVPAEGVMLWTERKVTLSDDKGEINYGTVDMIATDGERAWIFDWKFGRKINEDALSLQLAGYAAAANQSIQALKDLPIEAYAYFPRSGESLKSAPHEHSVILLIRGIVEAAKNSDGSGAVPGTHCDYCRHLPNCEAVRVAGQTEIVQAPDNALADPKRAVELYDLSLIVEKQCAAVRGRIREQLLIAPDSIPGLILKSRNGKRAATDDIKQRLVGPDGLSVIEYIKALTPNVVSLENAYLAKHYDGQGKGKITKGEIKKAFAELCGDAIKRTSSKVLTRVEG